MKSAAGKTARARALRLALLAVLLLPIVALARNSLGNAVPFDKTLLVIHPAPLSNFKPDARNTRLEPVAPGFGATLLGFFIWCGEAAQNLSAGKRGVLWFFCGVLILCGAWFGLAMLGEWRRPPIALLCLLALQIFGAAYYGSSFRAPPRRLITPFSAFDFHAHTVYSSGLLTPQQQIDWHRARGFSGLAFTDSDRMIGPREFAALVASNPDMKLLNACEYRGVKHLICLGITRAVSSREFDVPGAVREVKRQGGIVIVAHPWWPRSAWTLPQLAALGVDGFEPWNGQVQSPDVWRFVQAHKLLATTATDTLSKSGSHCFTWTILPRGLTNSANVLRALRLHKVAAAVALDADDTPQGYDLREARSQRIGAPLSAARAAWKSLTRAQKFATFLTAVALVSLVWAWGAEGRKRSLALAGPKRAVGFLRRRRVLARAPGIALMALAWLASIFAAIFALSWTEHARFDMTPMQAISVWFACDALYLYGRSLWHRSV